MQRKINLNTLKLGKPKLPLNTYKKYLLKRIVFLNLGTLSVIIFTYLWMLFFLSNVNGFWELFKGKEVYEQKDTIPPISPYIDPIPDAITGDNIVVSGRSEPAVKIILFVDGTSQSEVVTDNEGSFAFNNILVGLTPTKIQVMAKDDAGNQSAKSREYSIIQDKEIPTIEIITPKKGETFKSTERTYKVTGKTESGASVYVNGQVSITDDEGNFSENIALRDGGNEIKIKAIDKAGNELEEKIYMSFEKIE